MPRIASTSITTLTDSYKVTHWPQYPPGTEQVYSYFEPRMGGMFDEIVFFGLQYFLLRYLEGKVLTIEDIKHGKELAALHFGNDKLFNATGWLSLLEKHEGRLPILIKAVPEGTVVPQSNVLMTIENTDNEFPWLTNWLETLLVQVWYPSTVATLSREVKKIILHYLERTGDPKLIPFKLHDFGYRGSTSVESAGLGGVAHLVNFMGTDTMRALEFAQTYYGTPMAGFSIPASEHSTITSWGKGNESAAFANMLAKYPDGLVACVSDSYDIYNAVANLWGTELHKEVMGRNGTLVIRPDSGNPKEVIRKVCQMIWDKFGGTVNEKGFRVFDPHVRLIQGDGIKWISGDGDGYEPCHTVGEILDDMMANGFSADNIAFGSGGGLLQQMNRDTLRFAFKCSAIRQNGNWIDVYKNPVTQHGKISKKGRLSLVKTENGRLHTVPYSEGANDMLVPVFLNGEMLVEDSLDAIRERARVE